MDSRGLHFHSPDSLPPPGPEPAAKIGDWGRNGAELCIQHSHVPGLGLGLGLGAEVCVAHGHRQICAAEYSSWPGGLVRHRIVHAKADTGEFFTLPAGYQRLATRMGTLGSRGVVGCSMSSLAVIYCCTTCASQKRGLCRSTNSTQAGLSPGSTPAACRSRTTPPLGRCESRDLGPGRARWLPPLAPSIHLKIRGVHQNLPRFRETGAEYGAAPASSTATASAPLPHQRHQDQLSAQACASNGGFGDHGAVFTLTTISYALRVGPWRR